MTASVGKTLKQLRNTRDLRAEVVSLAAELVENDAAGHLSVVDSAISPSTVRAEWDRLLRALDPAIRSRMQLSIEQSPAHPDLKEAIQIDRPNYRHEVLRLLLGASLTPDGTDSLQGLQALIGASQTPIRESIIELKQAGVVHASGRDLRVMPEEISQELLARVGALPQTLRFRFERGARIKSPAELVERATALLGQTTSHSDTWGSITLSGAAVAHAQAPNIDLMGIPRVDLVARVPRDAKHFDAGLLRQLDDALEPEPSVLALTPVVVTLVRAETKLFPVPGVKGVRCSFPADVFLSLLDIGMREQALQYMRAIRR
ncbi:MAG: hypothetical protein ABI645_16955 [Pseudomonadota bacterium]